MSRSLQSDAILRAVPTISGFKVLTPCVLWDRIGSGGMGAVYLARHLNLDIDVAVKCLFGRLSESEAPLVARFQREARVAARINHPNLVRVYDVLEAHGVHYLVMEYVKGETLAQRTERRGPLSRDEAVVVLTAAASGVAELHRRDIVHRDLKPANVLLSATGEVKVADFGLVRQHGIDSEEITRTGVTFGTLSTMPPEQLEGASKVGPPADVWSLGATMFHALTGESAYPNSLGQMGIMANILSKPFPDVAERRGDLDEGLCDVLRRCVAKAPEERYADAGELLAALEALQPETPTDLSDVASAHARSGLADAEPPSKSISRDIQERFKSGSASAAGIAASIDPTEVETDAYGPGALPVVQPVAPASFAESVPEPTASPGTSVESTRPARSGGGWRWLVLVVALLALGVGGAVAFDRGWFDGTRGEPRDDAGARANGSPARGDPTDGEASDKPPEVPSGPPTPEDPPRPVFDRGALIESIRKVATEVHRARGSLRDVEDSRQDIRIFRSTGGMDAAIEKAEDAIDRARRLIEEYHSRAVEEAVLVFAIAAAFPDEAERVLEEELKGARDAWKEHRIDAIVALRTLVADLPELADQYEGQARRGLAHLFPR